MCVLSFLLHMYFLASYRHLCVWLFNNFACICSIPLIIFHLPPYTLEHLCTLIVKLCSPLCIFECLCTLIEHLCSPLYTLEHHCSPLYTLEHHCSPLYTLEHHCSPLCTIEHLCTLIEHLCSPLYTQRTPCYAVAHT